MIVDVDSDLLAKAKEVSGITDDSEVAEQALELFISMLKKSSSPKVTELLTGQK